MGERRLDCPDMSVQAWPRTVAVAIWCKQLRVCTCAVEGGDSVCVVADACVNVTVYVLAADFCVFVLRVRPI